MKIIYITTGLGRSGECFGEFSQAEASALYAKEKNNEIIFIIKNKRLFDILDKYDFQVFHSDDSKTTKQIISEIAPEVIILCNSKTVYMYKHSNMREPPLEPKPFICSIDSNWLFLEDKRIGFPVPTWIDRIFITFPKEIYKMGLLENGGHYKISDIYKKKISCVGFIPSSERITETNKNSVRKEFNIEKDEKLIIIYFGILEEFILPKFLTIFLQVIEDLIHNGFKVKVLFKGRAVINKKWIKCISWINDTQKFESIFASADLVIQHHGMGTLFKLIHNQIPVICLVEDIKRKWRYYRHWAYYEIEPFHRLNLCYSLPHSISKEMLKQAILDLLYDQKKIKQMRKAQNKYFQPGEKNLYDELLECLKMNK